MLVPNLYLSARSSSFLLAFFLHVYGEPFFKKHPILWQTWISGVNRKGMGTGMRMRLGMRTGMSIGMGVWLGWGWEWVWKRGWDGENQIEKTHDENKRDNQNVRRMAEKMRMNKDEEGEGLKSRETGE